MVGARRAPPLIAFCAAVFVGCGAGGPAVQGTPPAPLAETTILGDRVTIHGTATASARASGRASGRMVTIVTIDDYFTPTIVRGVPVAPVLIVLRNDGIHPHNFSVPSLSISRDIPPGETREASVAFPASGRLAFFCRFHRSKAGMLDALEADPKVPSPRSPAS